MSVMGLERSHRESSPPCGERVAGPQDRLGEGHYSITPPLTPPHKGEGNRGAP